MYTRCLIPWSPGWAWCPDWCHTGCWPAPSSGSPPSQHSSCTCSDRYLKVLTFDQWEKRWVESSIRYRSPFKLFSLRFSTKSVQAPSCERPKTTQRTLFLSFEIKNCYQIALLSRIFMKKSRKQAFHVVNWNITIDSSPTLQISLEIVAIFEKIYDGEPILTVVSNIGEDVQYRCFN